MPETTCRAAAEADELRAALEMVKGEVVRLEADMDRLRRPIDSYACQRCGRATGLDAVLPNDVWAAITGGRLLTDEVVDGRWNLLCLWCVDELCLERGVSCSVTLSFCGRAVHGTSQSDADAEHISRLVAEAERLRAALVLAKAEIARLRALLDERVLSWGDAVVEVARLAAVRAAAGPDGGGGCHAE
jgi:hypothetical protein